MLTQLDVYGPNITAAPYTLAPGGAPDTDILQIRNIEGLGPVTADINTSKLGTLDGEAYRDAGVGKRNIVITIGLNPDWATQTIESLRGMLYNQFMPKSKVRLVFTSTHLPVVEITGYVESCEPNIFSKDPEFQVSIICPYPHFVGQADVVVSGATNSGAATTINYIGTVPTGFVFDVNRRASSAGIGNMAITNQTSSGLDVMVINGLQVDTQTTFEFSTVDGNKYARYLYLPPVPSVNVLSKITSSSKYIHLLPGTNTFRVTFSPNSPETWVVTYKNRFGGL